MRRFLALLALLTAGPAVAQIAPRGPLPGSGWAPPDLLGDFSSPRGPGIGRDLADVRERIGDARDGGRLSRREARQLRLETRRVERLAERYGRDGLSGPERAHVEGLAFALRDAVNRPRADRGQGR